MMVGALKGVSLLVYQSGWEYKTGLMLKAESKHGLLYRIEWGVLQGYPGTHPSTSKTAGFGVRVLSVHTSIYPTKIKTPLGACLIRSTIVSVS